MSNGSVYEVQTAMYAVIIKYILLIRLEQISLIQFSTCL